MLTNKYGGKLIFEGRDAFGPIEIVDREKIRTLHFGTATEQSSMYLDDPFAMEMEYIRTMALGLLFRSDAKKVLCLGMGGGSLPKFIWKYRPQTEVTVVELSPTVIDVAHRFFYAPHDPRFQAICQDAIHFLRDHPQQEDDLIFVDLYVSAGIAPAVTEADFFACCDAKLNPGGILIWNMWQSASKDTLDQCLNNLCAIFGRNLVFVPNRESSNFVVMAFKEPIAPYTKDQIEEEAKHLDLGAILNSFNGYGSLFKNWVL